MSLFTEFVLCGVAFAGCHKHPMSETCGVPPVPSAHLTLSISLAAASTHPSLPQTPGPSHLPLCLPPEFPPPVCVTLSPVLFACCHTCLIFTNQT